MAMPYTVFLSGGIASGKSTVAKRMVELGAWRVDLDAVSREVLSPVGYAMMEGRRWPVPGNLEEYLSSLYGSTWNELPPPEKRRNHAPMVLDFGDGVNVLDTPASNA